MDVKSKLRLGVWGLVGLGCIAVGTLFYSVFSTPVGAPATEVVYHNTYKTYMPGKVLNGSIQWGPCERVRTDFTVKEDTIILILAGEALGFSPLGLSDDNSTLVARAADGTIFTFHRTVPEDKAGILEEEKLFIGIDRQYIIALTAKNACFKLNLPNTDILSGTTDTLSGAHDTLSVSPSY